MSLLTNSNTTKKPNTSFSVKKGNNKINKMKISPANDPIGQALIDYLNTNIEGRINVETNLTEDEHIPTSYYKRKEWTFTR